MKKLKCLLIGNCQNNAIMNYLSQSDEFSKTYEIKHYTNWQLIRDNCEVPMNDIQDADLFIFQPLRIVHGCYSTDPTVEGSIGYYVKDKCIKISYPYIFSSALWPLVQKGKYSNVWFGGEIVEDLISKGLTSTDILNMYDRNEIDWKYQDRFEKSLGILKNKESITDIKISNFIEENIQNELLFLIPQHPTSIIFLNIANQILEKLGMEKLKNFGERDIQSLNPFNLPDSTYDNPSGLFPVHESLIQYFGITYKTNYSENSKEFYMNRLTDYFYLKGHF
jgi:hypothetical protein